nr:AMP-binding protein [Muribaculaceae bacterium]
MIKIKNFIKLYEKSFIENWDLPALTDYVSGRTLTYGRVAATIAEIHMFFESNGVKPGSKVAICGKDSTSWVLIYMATVTYGAVIVPILQEFNPVDVTHIVNHSEAEILFIDEHIFEHIDPEKLLNVKGVMTIGIESKVLHEKEGSDFRNNLRLLRRRFRRRYPNKYSSYDVKYIDRDNSEVVEINYTSGTTGFSKGVMLTGENLAGNVCFGLDTVLHFRSSRALAFLPLAHAYGCAFDMLTPLAAGSHITLLGKTPSPRVLIKALAEVRPNLVICVPLILEKIYKNQILPMISKGTMRWTLAVPFLDSYIYA